MTIRPYVRTVIILIGPAFRRQSMIIREHIRMLVGYKVQRDDLTK